MNVTHIFIILLLIILPLPVLAADVTFRAPFTLKLHVDNERYYEENFDKIPYVHEGTVYLFKGDKFGLKLNLTGNKINGLNYVPTGQKSDITFEFSQEHMDSGTMMLLKITNNTQKKISMNALMTVPGEKRIFETTILPLEAGLTGYESWPHAIVQLALQNFQITP